MHYFLVMVGAMLGALGAWAVSRHGANLGLMDRPSLRSSHATPTPKGGGVGLVAAFVLACLVLGLPAVFCLAGVVIALLGFAGDRLDLSPRLRLACQLVASAAAWTQLAPPGLNQAGLIWLGLPATVLIAGTANFYNFMDGINGIAGGMAVVGFALLGLLASDRSDPAAAGMCFCLAASSLGFLPFNVPRARVFMGDVGSLLLGFAFACLAIRVSGSLSDFLVACVILSPVYSDELTTMAVRLRLRESLWLPHRRHLYQLLANQAGLAHWKVSLGFCLAQLGLGGLALWLRPFGALAPACLLGLGFALVGAARGIVGARLAAKS